MGRMCIIFESNTVRFDMFSSSGYRAPFVASVSFGDPFQVWLQKSSVLVCNLKLQKPSGKRERVKWKVSAFQSPTSGPLKEVKWMWVGSNLGV